MLINEYVTVDPQNLEAYKVFSSVRGKKKGNHGSFPPKSGKL